MKRYLSFFSLILIGSGIHSQPSIKVFGFEQENSPGIVAANVKDENGNHVKKAATQKNYFIYLSLEQKYSITPQQVFINGATFTIETSIIDTTPVEHINYNIPGTPQPTVLVPKTTNKVMKLKIVDPIQVEKPSTIEKLIKKNDLVVSYTWKDKKYFAVLKKFKTLEPLLNE